MACKSSGVPEKSVPRKGGAASPITAPAAASCESPNATSNSNALKGIIRPRPVRAPVYWPLADEKEWSMAQVPDITADSQVARIFEWRRGFNAIHLIDLGVHLGLFRALAEAPGQDAAALASKLGLQTHYVTVWCKTAYGLELLDADEQSRYKLAPHMDSILASATHPRYLGGYVRLGTEVAAE